MLSIQDVPNLLVTQGNEILAIPSRLDIEIKQVSQHRNRDGNDQSDSGDNVQILGRMVRVGKDQMITLAEGGMVKLQQFVNQVGRLKAEAKWHVFLGNIWGCLQNHITEKMQDVRSLVNEDVGRKLDGMYEMYWVDIGGLMLKFQESRIVLEMGMGGSCEGSG